MKQLVLSIFFLCSYFSMFGQKPGSKQLPYAMQDRLGCYWGYKIGKDWVIEPKYEVVNPFSQKDSLAIVEINGKSELINTKGESVLPQNVMTILRIDWRHAYRSNGFYQIEFEDSTRLYSGIKRKFIFSVKDATIGPLSIQNGTMILASNKDASIKGLATTEGIVIPLSKNQFKQLSRTLIVVEDDKEFHLMNLDGNLLTSRHSFDYIYPLFKSRFLVYEKDSLQGIIDTNGNIHLKAKWKINNLRPNEQFFTDSNRPYYYSNLWLYQPKKHKYNLWTREGEFLFKEHADSIQLRNGWNGVMAFYFKKWGKWRKSVIVSCDHVIFETNKIGEYFIYFAGQVIEIRADSTAYYYLADGPLLHQSAVKNQSRVIKYSPEYSIFLDNGLYYYYNQAGELIERFNEEPKRTTCHLMDGSSQQLYVIKKDGKWGAYSANMELVIPFEYYDFRSGYEWIVDPSANRHSYRYKRLIKMDTNYVGKKRYCLFIKNNKCYLMDDLLEGKEVTLSRAGNPNAPIVFEGRNQYESTNTLFISKKGNVLCKRKPFNSNLESLNDDSTLLTSRDRFTEVFSVELCKVIAEGLADAKYSKINTINFKLGNFLYRYDGKPILPGYAYVEPFHDKYYLATKQYKYFHFLTKDGERVMNDSAMAIAEWNETTRECFLFLHDRNDYTREYWLHVKIEQDGSLTRLDQDTLLEPYSINPNDIQTKITIKGIDILDENLKVVVSREYPFKVLAWKQGFVVINKDSQIALLNPIGETITPFYPCQELKLISDGFVIYSFNHTLWLLHFDGKRERFLKDRKLEEIKSLLAMIHREYEQVLASINEFSLNKQMAVLSHLLKLLASKINSRNYYVWYDNPSHYNLSYVYKNVKSHWAFGYLHVDYNSEVKLHHPQKISLNFQIPFSSAQTFTAQIIYGSYQTFQEKNQWNSSTTNYLIVGTELKVLQIEDVLNLSEANANKMNQLITEFILANENLHVKCTREGQYFEMVKDRFMITDSGLRFYIRNYRTNMDVPFDIPLNEIERMLKIEF